MQVSIIVTPMVVRQMLRHLQMITILPRKEYPHTEKGEGVSLPDIP